MPFDPHIQGFINQGKLTTQEARVLTPAASLALRDAGVRKLIGSDPLTPDEIADGKRLTIRDVLGLTPDASEALCYAGVRQLIGSDPLTADEIAVGKRLTIRDVLGLTPAASEALCDPETIRMLIDGRITLAQITGQDPGAHAGAGVPVAPADAAFAADHQNTHAREVTASVALSMQRLNSRYSIDLTALGEIRDYINASSDSKNKVAALSCLNWAIAQTGKRSFLVGRVSFELTLSEMLILVWIGAKDRTLAVEGVPRVDENFVNLRKDSLLEKLSEAETTYGGNRRACFVGVGNKIAEALDRAHPDVVVIRGEGHLKRYATEMVHQEAVNFCKAHILKKPLPEQKRLLKGWSEADYEVYKAVIEAAKVHCGELLTRNLAGLLTGVQTAPILEALNSLGVPDIAGIQSLVSRIEVLTLDVANEAANECLTALKAQAEAVYAPEDNSTFEDIYGVLLVSSETYLRIALEDLSKAVDDLPSGEESAAVKAKVKSYRGPEDTRSVWEIYEDLSEAYYHCKISILKCQVEVWLSSIPDASGRSISEFTESVKRPFSDEYERESWKREWLSCVHSFKRARDELIDCLVSPLFDVRLLNTDTAPAMSRVSCYLSHSERMEDVTLDLEKCAVARYFLKHGKLSERCSPAGVFFLFVVMNPTEFGEGAVSLSEWSMKDLIHCRQVFLEYVKVYATDREKDLLKKAVEGDSGLMQCLLNTKKITRPLFVDGSGQERFKQNILDVFGDTPAPGVGACLMSNLRLS